MLLFTLPFPQLSVDSLPGINISPMIWLNFIKIGPIKQHYVKLFRLANASSATCYTVGRLGAASGNICKRVENRVVNVLREIEPPE